MCGIFGIITNQKNILLGKVVLEGIKRLEYRGYDSCGIVSLSNSKLFIKKDSGKIDEIQLQGNTALIIFKVLKRIRITEGSKLRIKTIGCFKTIRK